MESLARLKDVRHEVVKAQRRLWLIQVLMWPTVVLLGVTVLATALWWRRRSSGGKHELPETPGAHRADATVTPVE